MNYQPIKFSKDQYEWLKEVIRNQFGNVSLARGIYIITFLYLKYVPSNIKRIYREKYYHSFNERRKGYYGGKK